MRDSAVGIFGINPAIILQLLLQPLVAPRLLDALTQFLHAGDSTPLWDTLLTAIPKPNRDTSQPKNTRPISVTSIWYRLLMKVFVHHLKPHLSTLYAHTQHGFCPGRSCLTAVTTLLPCLDTAAALERPLYVLALDLDKAYDTVARARLD